YIAAQEIRVPARGSSLAGPLARKRPGPPILWGQPNRGETNSGNCWVFNDPNWDWRTFDFDRDLAFADTKMAVVNSVDADLRPFKARNGKLVMYHGWADGNAPAADSIEYYERVKLAVGGSDGITDFFRLFLVPGMGHCSGGDG